MLIEIPYDKRTISADIDNYGSIAFLEQKAYTPGESAEQTVVRALENPIGSPRLSHLAKEAKRVLLITNDITRPMPSRITIPALINELRLLNPGIEITIIIASGLHRAMTREELVEKMGENIVDGYRIIVHDAYDKASLVYKGDLKSGNQLWLNKAIDEHDLIVAEGFIEAHWLAGFSGGRKSVFPGIAGCDSVMHNHGYGNVHYSRVRPRPGIMKGNPAHEEFCEAARVANLKFIMNVVLDKEKNIISAFAGDAFKAHEEGCCFVESLMEAPCSPADITITSNGGYPLDLNFYQGVKGIDTATFATRENGVIIMCCGCREGMGHGGFKKVFENAGTAEELLEAMDSGKIKEYDQWGSQIILDAVTRFKVILVSDNITDDEAELMFIERVRTLREAIDRAFEITGPEPSVNVIAEGPVILPRPG